jgi:hypothetical protein
MEKKLQQNKKYGHEVATNGTETLRRSWRKV